MKFLMLITGLLFLNCVSAQQPVSSVSGHISSAENKSVTNASVELHRKTDRKLIKVALSDRSGLFAFDGISSGEYYISCTSSGYETYTGPSFILSAGEVKKLNDAIIMNVQSKALSAVTVNAVRPLIEQKIDRTVVNVDASPTNAGATALEVLEKSPGVTVDNDGNISLKGKQGVIIMLDGKPTYLSGADLANVLRNLPAATLDRIEIMTNPSSKYDAAGNSGIIDIRTKKSKTRGSNGTVTTGMITSLFTDKGKTDILYKPSLSVNYNYKKNKINFFGNAVYNYRESRNNFSVESRYYRDGKQIDSINSFLTRFHGRNNNYTLKTGFDFSPDKKNTYGIVVSGFMFAGRPRNTTNTVYTDLAGNVFSKFNSYNSTRLSFKNFATNVNYRHQFDSTGTEFTTDFDYGTYSNISDQMLSTGFFNGNDVQTADSLFLRGHLPSEINIYSVKSDFTKNLEAGVHLETGFKSSYVKSDNLVNYERAVPAGWIPDARNNHFVYTENINAVYLNASKKYKSFELQTGLRAENTITKGEQASTNSIVKRNYISLFPSVFVSIPANKKNTLTVSASRRLQRPNYQDLNPFTYFLDSLSYRQGNPFLTPQFSYNYELTHNYSGKLITTLNYTNTKDVISNIINRKRGGNNEIIGFLTSDNIANFTNFGIAVNAPVKFSKWWSTNFFTNVYHNHYTGTYISNESGKSEIIPLDLAYTSFTVNVTNNIKLTKSWNGEISGFYRYKTVEQLNLSYPTGQVSFGLAKTNLLKGRASLRLNARDPFNWQLNRGLTKYGSVDISQRSRFDSRQYGVNFTYRFGTQQAQSRKRASATEEEQRRAGNGG